MNARSLKILNPDEPEPKAVSKIREEEIVAILSSITDLRD